MPPGCPPPSATGPAWSSWHRWTAISLLAYAFLAVAAAWQRARDGAAAILGLIPVTMPELLRQLRGTAIPEPRHDKPHRDAWTLWRRATSTTPSKTTSAGTPTPTSCHSNNDLQLPYHRWGPSPLPRRVILRGMAKLAACR
jgi:hypothetical protein